MLYHELFLFFQVDRTHLLDIIVYHYTDINNHFYIQFVYFNLIEHFKLQKKDENNRRPI